MNLQKILIFLLLQFSLRAEVGEIIEENGKAYLKDSTGKKSEILTGKRLGEFFTNGAKANFEKARYDLAKNYSQSSLESMVIAKEFDNDLIQKNLRMLLQVEKALGKTILVESQYLTYRLMAKLYDSLGGEQLNAKDYSQAKEFFTKSIQYDGKNAQTRAHLGIALDLLQDFPHAIESYQQAIVLEPNNAGHFFNLACSYSLQKNVKLSIENLEKSFQKGHDVKSAKTDDTLEFVRNSKEFKDLLKKYEK